MATRLVGALPVVAVAEGGTGANSASGARTNLSAAASGANSDITALSGLTGAVSKPTTITVATTGGLRTDTGAGNSALLQAYDTMGAAYTTFGTLTANNPPTFDIASSTTKGGAAIVVAGANSNLTDLTGLTGAISKPTSVTLATAGAIRTDTGVGNTTLLQAYDTMGTAYTTFAILTAGNPPTLDLTSTTLAVTGNSGFYGTSPVAQYSTTGTTTGFTVGIGTPVLDDSTFTGNTGATAYTLGDIVRALKLVGLIAS